MELSEDCFRIAPRVQWLDGRQALLLVLHGDERGILFLDVSAIHQHHTAQVGGGIRAMNRAAEAAASEDGNDAAVVNMSVAEEQSVNAIAVERQVTVAF